MLCRALLNAELQRIFREAKPNPTIVAPQSIRDAYNQAMGSSSKSGEHTAGESSLNKNHKDPEGDDCAVCYEPMKAEPESNALVWCETCNNVGAAFLRTCSPSDLPARHRHFTQNALINVRITPFISLKTGVDT